MLAYLNGPDVVYLAPTPNEATAHRREWEQKTWEDLPSDKKDKNFVLNFKGYLLEHNPNEHTNFAFTANEMLKIFADGLHSKLIPEANRIISNAAYFMPTVSRKYVSASAWSMISAATQRCADSTYR